VNERLLVSSSTSSKGSAPSSDGQGRQRLLLALGGLVVLAFIVGIAVLSTGERGSRVTTEDLAGSPTIEGEPLAPGGQDTQNDPELGSQAPVVTGADFEGTPVTIGEPGTPQLIMFMASWCPACQEELRSVSPWLAEGGLRDDVALVAVSTGLDDSRPNWPPDEWFESEGFEDPVLVDDADGSVASAYGLTATPFWVGLDAQGQVVARAAGMLPVDQIEVLADAVAGGPA
jgi:cytochrome c biogenesis protein CcmG, thiol:disulfide interchange protein DsbE